MDWQAFHFVRPWWFLALLPALAILLLLLRQLSRHSVLNQHCDSHLLQYLWLEKPGQMNRLVLYLLGGGWLLAVIALAGPVWEQQPQPVFRAQAARVIVLDLSPSMNLSDLSPSRLERARYKLADILARSGEGRTALVVFSGEAHVVTPLTSDVATIETMLPALSTDIIPAAGDNAASGLALAGELLDRAGVKSGDVLLLTDGVSDAAAALEKTVALQRAGHRISVLGASTEAGAPVLAESGGFKGMARIDLAAMHSLASSGNGQFMLLQPDDRDLDALLLPLQHLQLAQQLDEEGEVDRWIERGVWLLPLLLLLAASAFRRGWLTAVLLVLILPPPAQAFEWQDLWLRADQQGLRALNQGNPAIAAEKFKATDWRGAALYQAGDYEAAIDALTGLPDEVSRYNRANALARAGRLAEALTAYQQILQQNPEHTDAAHNLKVVEEALKKPPPEDQQDQPDPQNQPDQPQNQQDQQQNDQDNAGQQKPPPPLPQGEGDSPPPTESAESPSAEPQQPPQREAQLSPDDEPNDAAKAEPQQTEPESPANAPAPGLDAVTPGEPPDPAAEQWLRQLPDDPSGLLRRKFMLEHLRRKQELQGS